MTQSGMLPQVSVVIPTYNRADLLRLAIDSVLTQSFTDLEVVVVDDGSSDNTRQVVNAYADRRIHYMYKANAGLGAARNTGIEHARAEYVAFLDSDDLFLPDGLARQLETLTSADDVGFAAGGFLVVDEQGRALAARRPWINSPRLDVLAAVRGLSVVPSGVVVRKTWLERVGGFSQLQPMGAEDTDLWRRLAYHGCQMQWTKHLVSAYRIHTGQMIKDGRSQTESALIALDRLYAADNLPADLLQERERTYAGAYLTGAFREYGANQIEDAKRSLAHAIKLDPTLMAGEYPGAANALVGMAASPGTGDPTEYVERVLANLPPVAERLSALRQRLTVLAVLRAALDAIQVDNLALARSRLAHADAATHCLRDNPDLLVELMVEAVRTCELSEQESLLASCFAVLPSDEPQLRRKQRKALGRLYMARCFSCQDRGARREGRSWAWRGVRQDPLWLKNRGVVSILIKPIWLAQKAVKPRA